MKGYRVYYINSADRIVDALDLACEDETTAVYQANRLGNGRALELWERDRLIVRFPTMKSFSSAAVGVAADVRLGSRATTGPEAWPALSPEVEGVPALSQRLALQAERSAQAGRGAEQECAAAGNEEDQRQ